MRALHLLAVCAWLIVNAGVAQGQCDCPNQFDPNNNGIDFEIGDAVVVVEVVYGNRLPTTTGACPCADGDLDCDGVLTGMDIFRMLRVICGSEWMENICQPGPDCSIDHCAGPAAVASGGAIIVESKTVPVNAQGVEVGIYVSNPTALGSLTLPLEIRSLTPGSLPTGDLAIVTRNRIAPLWGQTNAMVLEFFYPAPSPLNGCSGPVSSSYDSSVTLTPPVTFTSPAALLWTAISCDGVCLPPGDDGVPDAGNPSLALTFDVTGVPGSFEIDSCCIAPGSHLTMIDCDGDSLIAPSFTKGVITIAPCDCPRQMDPNHNGIAFEIGDLVRMFYLAFGGDPISTSPSCVCADGDVDCNGTIDVVDLLRMLAVISENDGSRMCVPAADCSLAECPPAPAISTAGGILIESKTVVAGEEDVTLGVYLDNGSALSALTLPLEFRTIDGGFIHNGEVIIPPSSRIPSPSTNPTLPVIFMHPEADSVNSCSGPLANSYGQWDTILPGFFPSPFGLLWSCMAPDQTVCIPAGDDGTPGSGTPSIQLVLDIASFLGSFEIDTCCMVPGTHLAMVECGADTVFSPSFTKGIVTVTSGPCDCSCLADPQCDGAYDIVDVTSVINAAFRAGVLLTDPQCPYARQDVDCGGDVNIADMVRMVDVAFRGQAAETKFCNGCP